jgi:hypothetical protein
MTLIQGPSSRSRGRKAAKFGSPPAAMHQHTHSTIGDRQHMIFGGRSISFLEHVQGAKAYPFQINVRLTCSCGCDVGAFSSSDSCERITRRRFLSSSWPVSTGPSTSSARDQSSSEQQSSSDSSGCKDWSEKVSLGCVKKNK